MKKNINPILATTLILNNYVAPLGTVIVNAEEINEPNVSIHHEVGIQDNIENFEEEQSVEVPEVAPQEEVKEEVKVPQVEVQQLEQAQPDLREQSSTAINQGEDGVIQDDQQTEIEENGVNPHEPEKASQTNTETTYDALNSTVNENVTTYKAKSVSFVNDFAQLQEAVKKSNNNIVLGNHIIFTESIEVLADNITIYGQGNTMYLEDAYSLIVKSSNFNMEDLTFEDYADTALKLYSAKNVSINDVIFRGKDSSLENSLRSKVGLDVYKSEVTINNTQFSNHVYRGIQLRDGANITIGSNIEHFDDKVDMQTIYVEGQTSPVINDANGLYTHGSEYLENGKKTVDYYIKKLVDINSASDLDGLKPGTIATLQKDIVVNQVGLPDQAIINFEISNNVVINGNNKTIDLNNQGSITLKGKDVSLKDTVIKNSADHGVNIYNGRNVLLQNVTVESSKNWGIFVNGSQVKLDNVTTYNNTSGGIQVTRSRTLRLASHIDSVVEVVNSLNQAESNINVGVTNLEMLDGTMTDNQFIVQDDLYNKYVNDTKYAKLSPYYLELFKIPEDQKDREYAEVQIDYMLIQQELDVTTQTEAKDGNGNPIQLVGDGQTDETDKIKQLIEYAALHGKTLYFPQGTYVISEDINFLEINLPALSNFTIKGDQNGLSVIDGSSKQGSMAMIHNSDYHAPMNYVKFDNMVFNNVGIEINGPYKKAVSLTNNVFINGKYTSHLREDGTLEEVTLDPYIMVKNNKYTIENNVFLRGENYPGRGIATYSTNNTSIKNNFFGDLSGLSDAATMLPSSVIEKAKQIQASGLVDGTDQGNFMTAINNERYDKNVLIENNYFNIDKMRNIRADFAENILITGIDVENDGQRRDHIIYSKGYNGLNIVGNYFEGMENSAAGGVKIRNGKGAYVGSNNFNDVPLLTYIYNDLTPEEVLLHDTVIYNNIFLSTTNFGGEGTGILYYQSFFDSADVVGDVQNFIIYNNQFVGDERLEITISHRAKEALAKGEFYASGNTYTEIGGIVNYHKGNASLTESTEQDVLAQIPTNSGYNSYKNTKVPMTPVKVDTQYLSSLVNKIQSEIKDLIDNGMIGENVGQYPDDSIKELERLMNEIRSEINGGSLTQSETNKTFTKLEETFNSLSKNQTPPSTPDSKPDVNVPNQPDSTPDVDVPSQPDSTPDVDVPNQPDSTPDIDVPNQPDNKPEDNPNNPQEPSNPDTPTTTPTPDDKPSVPDLTPDIDDSNGNSDNSTNNSSSANDAKEPEQNPEESKENLAKPQTGLSGLIGIIGLGFLIVGATFISCKKK